MGLWGQGSRYKSSSQGPYQNWVIALHELVVLARARMGAHGLSAQVGDTELSFGSLCGVS